MVGKINTASPNAHNIVSDGGDSKLAQQITNISRKHNPKPEKSNKNEPAKSKSNNNPVNGMTSTIKKLAESDSSISIKYRVKQGENEMEINIKKNASLRTRIQKGIEAYETIRDFFKK